jgi:ATP-binding cassette subfamily C (CFTR/MRP) protein 1
MPNSLSVTSLFATSWVIKSVTLVLEAREKQTLLRKTYENSSIESTSGVLNRAVFWWLNGLLWRGSKEQLTVDSLPALDSNITAASDPRFLFENWNKGMSEPPASSLTH